MSCRYCGKPLTLAEAYYYETRCEACEQAWSSRIAAWRTGQTVEPELDAFYSADPKGEAQGRTGVSDKVPGTNKETP